MVNTSSVSDQDSMIVSRIDYLFQGNDRNNHYDGPFTRVAILRKLHDAVLSSGHYHQLAYVGALFMLGMEPFRKACQLSNVIDPPDAAIHVVLPSLTADDIEEAKLYVASWLGEYPPGVAVLPETLLIRIYCVQHEYWSRELDWDQSDVDVSNVVGETIFGLFDE